MMEPVTLITTAAIAGAITVANKVLDKGTEHVWDSLMAKLRGRAAGNEEAMQALTTADDPEAVAQAVTSINAAADPEILQLAQQVNDTLPQQQIVQIAKMIQNVYGGTVNQTFNL